MNVRIPSALRSFVGAGAVIHHAGGVQLVFAVLAIAGSGATMFIVGGVLRDLMDGVYQFADPHSDMQFLALVLSIAAAQALSIFVRKDMLARISATIAQRVRVGLFIEMMAEEISRPGDSHDGKIAAKLGVDTFMISGMPQLVVGVVAKHAALFFGAIVAMVMISAVLGAVVLVIAVLCLAAGALTNQRIARSAQAERDQHERLVAYVVERARNLSVVVTFNRQRFEAERCRALAADAARMSIRREQIAATFNAFTLACLVMALFGLLFLGSRLTADGSLTAGQFTQFTFLGLLFVTSALSIVDALPALARLPSLGHTFNAYYRGVESNTVASRAGPGPLPNSASAGDDEGSIVFEKVDFAMAGRVLFDQVDFRVAPGEWISIVGDSGAGKTSLAELLVRLSKEQSGDISVCGRSATRDGKDAVREKVAYVPQDAQIFSGTVRDNLQYGVEGDSKDAALDEVVDRLGIRDFVAAMPFGLDSEVGDCGRTLSGGQRQRIAIARALLSDRPILLLDEATSGLDEQAEFDVLQAVQLLRRGRTVLSISHRPSARRMADRVLHVGATTVGELAEN